MKSKVAIQRCQDYTPALVQEAVRKAIDSLGGISAFIKAKSRVLVKPNLLMAIAPECGVTTHPEVVRAVIRMLKEIDCRIYLGDGPSAFAAQGENPERVYELSGIKRLAEEEGVELVIFDQRRWREKFPVTTWLDNCDYLVSVPKFKTHELTILTAAIKNLYGLICGTFKVELHKKYSQPQDFADTVVDIYALARPALTVVDGIVAMEGDGPGTGGKLRTAGLILAGADGVAIDSLLARIMGLAPQDILTTKKAAARGLGMMEEGDIQILGEKLEEVAGPPFLLPTTSLRRKLPPLILNTAKKFIRFYPRIEHQRCTRCQICIQTCPQKVMRMQNNRVTIAYKGCISCFCCQEACPSAAIKVKKSLLAKLAGL